MDAKVGKFFNHHLLLLPPKKEAKNKQTEFYLKSEYDGTIEVHKRWNSYIWLQGWFTVVYYFNFAAQIETPVMTEAEEDFSFH